MSGDPRMRAGPGLSRRRFLQASAAAGAAVLAPHWPALGDTTPRVRSTVTLGRTGLRVPDIGFGSSRLDGGEDLVRHALERGVTYFDTAESYQGGRSEETLGRALAGRRDEVVLGSKVKCEANTPRGELMASLEASLKRLRTDRIDVYFNHAVNDPARLRNPEWGEFVDRARAAGKIRFTGLSGHGGRLVECLEAALEAGSVDVVLVGYNFGQDPAFYERFTRSFDFVAIQPELPQVLARAHAQGVGVIAMKTLRGARLNDMRPYERAGGTFAQAAFRWTLSSPHVDALVVSMKSTDMIDEYLGASGAAATSASDVSLLQHYEEAQGGQQCRYGCALCLDACPRGVAIPELLRVRMYAEDYGERADARAEHRALGAPGKSCLACDVQTCAGACPFGLDIPALTTRGARLLA